jgi:hypothetical protein
MEYVSDRRNKYYLNSTCQLHLPSKNQIIKKTTIVPKQPPPNFHAPNPDIRPLKRLFMV